MDKQEFIQGVESLRGELLRQAMQYLDRPQDAEDAVQETLVKLWMAKDRVANRSNLGKMAATICRNVSLNMARTTKRYIPIVGNRVAADEAQNPHRRMEEQDGWQQLRQSIHTLTDKQRLILRMRNVQGMPYTDIARIIGTTESSVRGMISRARTDLLRQLQDMVL